MTDSPAPDPSAIFARAVEEGKRRLDQSLVELISTSFIAGFTIIFGIVVYGIVVAITEPLGGELPKLVGALFFGVGVVFLVVGRAELFNENFFDPTAAVVEDSNSRSVGSLARLWVVTFLFNLVGGGLFAVVFSVDDVLPSGSATALRESATHIMAREPVTWFASAIVGGALVTLLSFLLAGVNQVGSRITLAYVVGVLLALGPFDHVIVTALHVFVGVLFGTTVEYGAFVALLIVVTAGNFVGGIGLVTLTHVVQALGARESDA